MRNALAILTSMEINDCFLNCAPGAEQKQEQLKNEYAETMTLLVKEITESTGSVMHENVVTIAEKQLNTAI